ncbi:hypothetical protein EGH21_14035 [Halomicroarcula sp. F13]|uniref:Uncharacterized protein n=1 Tax=Haloarcula rubra TaxID=2487747 RepID=A0AAW4PT28_9EURY|nr:hypothetical protein [Halomicroarcula rubra]MBX0324153.1 hypothetical protein [Halomicroarcula rubra]
MNDTRLSRAGRAETADRPASSVRGSLGLVVLFVGVLLVVSYPVFALGVLLGAVGTVAVTRLSVAATDRRRSRGHAAGGRRRRTRGSRPE